MQSNNFLQHSLFSYNLFSKFIVYYQDFIHTIDTIFEQKSILFKQTSRTLKWLKKIRIIDVGVINY